mgnify:CR=1 FL=1
MSDYSDSPHRRDRQRRHKYRDGRGSAAGGTGQKGRGGRGGRERSEASGREASGRQEQRRDRRPEVRQEARIDLPPLPKLPTPLCPRCGEPIQDVTSALSDKATGEPMHFDCVLSFLQGAETLGTNEKIVYIGQGRFAVMFFENLSDTRKFKIVRTIEWEGREARPEWRSDISGLFSQVK